MSEIEQYIETYFGIKNSDADKFATLFKKTTLKKGDYYTKTNSYCKQLSFISSGYLRVFALNDDKEITQWISSPGQFVTELSSMLFGSPSRFNIQALTDCELLTISKENYDKIGEIIPDWDYLEKLFISKCFVTLENRVFSFLSMTAEERYQHLYAMDKDLFNRVPLNYLASMLGMTPETLSRIRKKSIS